MEAFKDVSMAELGRRYKGNELALVNDLMAARLLQSGAPQCHGKMAIYPSDPWMWRCCDRRCNLKKAVADGSFFENYRKRFEILEAVLMWGHGDSPQQIRAETGFSKTTVAKLLKHYVSARYVHRSLTMCP